MFLNEIYFKYGSRIQYNVTIIQSAQDNNVYCKSTKFDVRFNLADLACGQNLNRFMQGNPLILLKNCKSTKFHRSQI